MPTGVYERKKKVKVKAHKRAPKRLPLKAGVQVYRHETGQVIKASKLTTAAEILQERITDLTMLKDLIQKGNVQASLTLRMDGETRHVEIAISPDLALPILDADTASACRMRDAFLDESKAMQKWHRVDQ